MKNAIRAQFFVNEASKVTIFDNFIRIETFIYVRSALADVLLEHHYDDEVYKLLKNKCSKPYVYYCVELPHGKYASISVEANKAYCRLKSRKKFLTAIYKDEIKDALFDKAFQSTLNFNMLLMARHDGRTAAKKQAFHDMYKDDITLCKYDMLGTDVLIRVILTESNVIGINIDDKINILIDIYSY